MKVNGTSLPYARGLGRGSSGIQAFFWEERDVDGISSSSSTSSIFGFTCFLTYLCTLFFPYLPANQYCTQTIYGVVGYFFFVTPKTVFVQIQACKLTISELLIALGFPVCPISYHPMPVLYTDLCVCTSQGFCCNTNCMFLPRFKSPRTPLHAFQGLLLEGDRDYSRAGSFTPYPVSRSYLSRSCPTGHPGPGTMTWAMQHMVPSCCRNTP